MNYIKLYEDFSPFGNLKERINNFYESILPILEEYEDPEINLTSTAPQVNGLKDIYEVAKSCPKDLLNFCKLVYNENQEEIDNLSLQFKSGVVNEEMCLLTMLSLGLMALCLWLNWPAIKQRLSASGWLNSRGAGGYKTRYLDKMKPSEGMQKVKREYRDMNPEELQKELNKELDKGNMDKVKEISKYL